MTPDQLRQIAEACNLTVAPTSRPDICEVWDDTARKFFGSLGPKQGDGYSLFAPHLDANQAIECLDRRFSNDGHAVWNCERYGDKCTVYGLLDSWVEGEPADSFASAAMSAILESLR